MKNVYFILIILVITILINLTVLKRGLGRVIYLFGTQKFKRLRINTLDEG